MPSELDVQLSLSPITALACTEVHPLYLLVGDAQYLKIYDHESHDLIHTEKVFQTQAIHGIISHINEGPLSTSFTLLIWGGRSVRAYEVSVLGNEAHPNVQSLGREIDADDWILDGCFTFGVRSNGTGNALLLTAHNELLEVDIAPKPDARETADPVLKSLTFGPRSILYSAHILWTTDESILIAAGTVFGEVIFWSVSYDVTSSKPLLASIRHIFTGHGGSVFGVRISEKIQLDGSSLQRVLASCSDDRTIRLWDISKFVPNTTIEQQGQCLATVMGHASRIWGLRFLSSSSIALRVMSLGEDGTTQSWCLTSAAAEQSTKDSSHTVPFVLNHESTFAHHSGKNIWAAATSLDTDGNHLFFTGGADGRIASYRLENKSTLGRSNNNQAEYTMTDVLPSGDIISNHQIESKPSTVSQILSEMEGSWTLSRSLKSTISSYPSGNLEGTATFEKIPLSDSSYDAEWLYSEQGDFKTLQGLTMKATRKYVYRYQKDTNSISAWFVKPDGGASVDYLFHALKFDEDTTNGLRNIWRASGHHRCISDDYVADYLFELEDGKLNKWGVRYAVKGLQKDYIADATYTQKATFRNLEEAPSLNRALTPPKHGIKQQKRSTDPFKGSHDAFKSYVWISESEFLSTTEQGKLLLGSVNTKRKDTSFSISRDVASVDVTWTLIEQKDQLRPSAILSSIVSRGIALLTGNNGDIFLYGHEYKGLDVVHSVPGKVAYMKFELLPRVWTGTRENSGTGFVGVVVKCLGSTNCEIVFLEKGESSWHLLSEESRVLELRKDFVVTSSCFTKDEHALILGSRNGDLVLFDLLPRSSMSDFPDYMYYIHGQEAVTAIQVIFSYEVSVSSHGYHVLTTGRNGRFAVHQISVLGDQNGKVQRNFSLVHMGTPPFGPNIEGAFLDPETDDILLWGFRSKEFVVWNESKKTETMTVECGGAHRNWAFSPLANRAGGGRFVWTRASVCNIQSQLQVSHQVIQSGGHGREIKALAVSPLLYSRDGSLPRLIATGAEDTAIRLFDTKFRCLSIQTNHTTGIQKLHWSPDGEYLFSAAGCEEFFIWRVQPGPCRGIAVGIYCDGACQPVSDEQDLRIMDFAVVSEIKGDSKAYLITMVYSDSSVRLFRYSADTRATDRSPVLLVEANYATCCLTVATWPPVGSYGQLCTAGSDGRLVLWSLMTAKRDDASIGSHDTGVKYASQADPIDTLEMLKFIPVHQSSIKCSAIAALSAGDSVIVTGGDDQAIAFTRLTYSRNSPPRTSTILIPNAHASAITALAYLGATGSASDHRFASVGSDQRLSIWTVSIGAANRSRSTSADSRLSVEQDREMEMTVRREHSVYTSVADASSLDAYFDNDRASMKLVIAGIGMESRSLWLEKLSGAD